MAPLAGSGSLAIYITNLCQALLRGGHLVEVILPKWVLTFLHMLFNVCSFVISIHWCCWGCISLFYWMVLPDCDKKDVKNHSNEWECDVGFGYWDGMRQILWLYSYDAMDPNRCSSYNSSLHLISDTIIDCRRMQGLVMDLLCNSSDSLRHIPYCHGFWLFADVLTRYLLKGVENWWGLQICISGLECYGEPVWTRRRFLLLLWWWLV
jgi:hypothetical protein